MLPYYGIVSYLCHVLLLFSIAIKVIFCVCGSLSLNKEDEEIIHQTIHRTFEEEGKGFIAWLKNGRLTVDTDVLVQLLNPALTMSFVMPPSRRPRGGDQGLTFVPLHSFDQRLHVEQPPERKLGYGWETENLKPVSLSAATPSYNAEQNRVIGKLVLKSKLRYGHISFDSADVEFLGQEFWEIPGDLAKSLLKTFKHVDEKQVKIMSIPSHNQQLVYVGDQGIEMADNDLLLLKTRVRNGLVSFHEDDIEARYPADWRVPGYILKELKRKGSNGKLFIISDEKGNLKSCIKSEKKDRFVGARNKALAFFTSNMPTKESASKTKFV